LDQGFNHFYGLIGGMVDYFSHKTVPFVGNAKPVLDWHRNHELNHDVGYATDLLADESIRFIENSPVDEPFLLYVAFNAPHLPLQAKAEHLNLSAEEVKLTRILFTADNKVNRQILSAMVTSLDDNIGRILSAIDEHGFRENTLVLFLSDNGGQIERGASDNSPLRGSKNSVWEGGVRVPAAVRWPAVLEGGKKITQPIAYIDVFPTLRRIVGLSDASMNNIDGVDVLDVLTGKQQEFHRRIYLGPGTMVSRRWKLVEGKLFQIDSDPSETTDVAEDYHDIVERLREEIRQVEARGSP
jgi:arylsulfatase B